MLHGREIREKWRIGQTERKEKGETEGKESRSGTGGLV